MSLRVAPARQMRLSSVRPSFFTSFDTGTVPQRRYRHQLNNFWETLQKDGRSVDETERLGR